MKQVYKRAGEAVTVVVMAIMFSILLGLAAFRNGFSVGASILALGGLATILIVSYRTARIRVELSDSELKVVNVLKTHHIDVSDIEHVESVRMVFGKSLRVVHKNGSTLVADALNGKYASGRSDIDVIADAINRRLSGSDKRSRG